MKKNNTVLLMAEISVLSALALALDFVQGLYSEPMFPNGGSIGIAMVPIFVLAFRRGLIPGLTSGFIVGVIQTIFNVKFLEIFQYILDYPVPFLLLGVAGLFSKYVKNSNPIIQRYGIVVGVSVAGLLRYASHYLAGVTFWRAYIPTDWNIHAYSLAYNGAYMVPSIVLSVILVLVLNQVARKLFLPVEETTLEV